MDYRANKKEYMRIRKNFQNRLSRLRTQGFIIDVDLEPVPKNIYQFTPQRIERLKEFTSGSAKRFAHAEDEIGYENANVYKEHRTYNYDTDHDIPSFVEIVIQNFYAEIQKYMTLASPILKHWAETVIRETGKENFAIGIRDAMSSGLHLTGEIAYKAELLNAYIEDLMDFMPEIGDMEWENIMDEMEGWSFE